MSDMPGDAQVRPERGFRPRGLVVTALHDQDVFTSWFVFPVVFRRFSDGQTEDLFVPFGQFPQIAILLSFPNTSRKSVSVARSLCGAS